MPTNLLMRRFRAAAYAHLPFPNIGNWAYRRAHRSISESWCDAPFFLLHVPKCAGTSIVNAMGLSDPGHLLVHELDTKSRKMLNGKDAFIVVRDPIERIISTFIYIHNEFSKGNPNYLFYAAKYNDINVWIQIHLVSYLNTSHYFFQKYTYYIISAIKNDMNVHISSIERLNDNLLEYSNLLGFDKLNVPVSNKRELVSNLNVNVDCNSRATIRKVFENDVELHENVRDCGLVDASDVKNIFYR